MGICLSSKRKNKKNKDKKHKPQEHSRKVYLKEDRPKKKISITISDKQKSRILKKRSSVVSKNSEKQAKSQNEKLNLEHSVTLQKNLKFKNESPQPAQEVKFTTKLSSTVDNSKLGLKNSLVMQRNTLKRLTNGSELRKAIEDSERLALNPSPIINEKATPENYLKNVIEVKEKLALNIDFGDIGSIQSGMFTGVLSVNTEHLENIGNVEERIKDYNRSSKARAFVRKNCMLPGKLKNLMERKSNRHLKRVLSLKQEPQDNVVEECNDAQSEDVKPYGDSRFKSKKAKDVTRRVSYKKSRKKQDGRLTLQKFVLKKNQLNFVNKKNNVKNIKVVTDLDGEIMKKKREKNRDNLSEDNFSSSSSGEEDSDMKSSNKVEEIVIDFESSQTKKTKQSRGELRKTFEANNCTIEKMILDCQRLEAGSSKFSEFNGEPASEFSLESEKDSEEGFDKVVSPSMKLFTGAVNININSADIVQVFESQEDEELDFEID